MFDLYGKSIIFTISGYLGNTELGTTMWGFPGARQFGVCVDITSLWARNQRLLELSEVRRKKMRNCGIIFLRIRIGRGNEEVLYKHLLKMLEQDVYIRFMAYRGQI